MTEQTLNVDVDQLKAQLPPAPGVTGPAPAAPGAAPASPAQGPAAAGVNTGEMITALLDITFNIGLAAKRGPHWKMPPEDCAQLGNAYGAVVDKYMPDLRTGPELTAIMVSVPILLPRILADLAAGKPAPAKPADQDTEKVDPDIVIKGKAKPNAG